MNIGASIKKNRIDLKLKQYQLAEKLNVSQSFICQLERNKKNVSISILNQISEILNIPLPLLFWSSLTVEDVKNKEYYSLMKPTIDKMIKKLMI